MTLFGMHRVVCLLPSVTCTQLAAGFEDEASKEMMRLYQTIHTDHEVFPHSFLLGPTCPRTRIRLPLLPAFGSLCSL